MSARAHTIRVRRFERRLDDSDLGYHCSAGQLQRLLLRGWRDVVRTTRDPPRLLLPARPGRVGAWCWSHYDPSAHAILLHFNHRVAPILFHEMAHAWTNRGLDHGPAFQRRYVELLAWYGKAEPEIMAAAMEAKL